MPEKNYSVSIDVYVTEDHYVGQVENDDHRERLESNNREIESVSEFLSQKLIDEIVADHRPKTIYNVCDSDLGWDCVAFTTDNFEEAQKAAYDRGYNGPNDHQGIFILSTQLESKYDG